MFCITHKNLFSQLTQRNGKAVDGFVHSNLDKIFLSGPVEHNAKWGGMVPSLKAQPIEGVGGDGRGGGGVVKN